MSIKGLTDRNVAFPQIGNIRKGAKKTDEKRPGAELPYFRVEFDEREVDAIAIFSALYPDGKPTDILFVTPFDEIDRVWEAWREKYSAGSLLHRCDGEYIKYAVDPNTGEEIIKDWHNARGEMSKCTIGKLPSKDQRCKPTGRLHVIIPQLERLAYLVVHTTSIWDIAHISEQIAGIYQMNGNHIAGVPLILQRRPAEISTPSGENGKRVRRVKYLIHIEADPEWVAAKLRAMRSTAISQTAIAPQLQAPIGGPEWAEEVGDDDDEDEVIENGAPIDPANDDPTFCKIHQVKMPDISSKSGLPYHRLKLDSGDTGYCNGVTTVAASKHAYQQTAADAPLGSPAATNGR